MSQLHTPAERERLQQECVRFIRAYLDAYMSGDADAAARLYAPAYFVAAAGTITVFAGDEIASRLRQMRAATQDRGETEVSLVHAEPRPLDRDVVLVHCRLQWRGASVREQDVTYLLRLEQSSIRICGVFA